MSSQSPKWVTLDRQHLLVELFLKSNGFCVYGHNNCLIPEHHYEVYTELLIDDWKQDDRQARVADWVAERIELHRANQRRYPLKGQFSAVSRDIFFDRQPFYYLLGYGISGLTFKPFAQVRLPSNRLSLYVDIGDTLKGLSKSKKRKAIRYGKPLASERKADIESKCKQAVKHYLENR